MSVSKGKARPGKPGAGMLKWGLAGKALNLLEKQQQRQKKKKGRGKGPWVLLGSPEVWFLYHFIFLPADPQMSMAATAAVSPSDYLQPAAATTQASALCALRAGPEPGRVAEVGFLSHSDPFALTADTQGDFACSHF